MKTKYLSYQQSGQGNTVVLLHGFCENKSLWDEFIPMLAENYKVISLDLAGFGGSKDLIEENHTIEMMAEQIHQLLAFLQCEKVTFIGHSLGGYVALAYAELYPQLVNGILLFHSTALADNEEKKKSRNNVIELVKKKGTAEFIKTFIGNLFYNSKEEILKEKLELVRQMVLKTPTESIIAISNAMRERKDRSHVLQDALYPVGFIIGKNDSFIPFEQYKTQVFLPKQSIVHILDETGHIGMLEREKESSLMLQSFLKHTDFFLSNQKD